MLLKVTPTKGSLAAPSLAKPSDVSVWLISWQELNNSFVLFVFLLALCGK